MLQGDLWIKRLATEANIELETSLQLWLAFSRSFIHRLEEGDCFNLETLGYWSLSLSDEYLVGEEEPTHIMPPSLALNIETNVNTDSYRLDSLASALEIETGVRLDAIERWLNAIVPLTLRLVEAGYEVVWSGIGSWAKQDSLIFSLNKELSDIINKPFACFTPEPLKDNEDIPALKYRAISIDKALELNPIILALPATNAESKEIVSAELEQNNTAEVEPTKLQAEEVVIVDETITIEEEIAEEQEAIPVISGEEEEPTDTEQEETIEETPKKQIGGLIAIALGLIALALVASLFFTPGCSSRTNSNQAKANTITPLDSIRSEVAQDTDTTAQILAVAHQDVLEVSPKVSADTLSTKQAIQQAQADVAKTEVQAKPKESVQPKTIPSTNKTNLGNNPNQAEEIELKADESLASLAKEKYGHRAFWVYIYEENRELIANPHSVPIGTKLQLPPASKYGIDAKNTKSVDQALILSRSLQ